ncbi:MAG: hypothetical protein K0S04_3965 [Herbinix sp.]|nr:hypothetical protein [Herbinix sp.]
MAKHILRVLLALTILTAVAAAGIYYYNLDRTYYNSDDEIGNTAGNIYNGGLFCQQDDKIYFSNNNAGGRLFVTNDTLSSFQLVSNSKAVYINADDDYIYYVQANNTKETSIDDSIVYYNTGAYRIKHNGSNLTAFTADPSAYLTLKGNYLYLQKYNVDYGLCLYRYKIDKTEERLLVKDAVIPTKAEGDYLYYSGRSKDLNIHSLDLLSYTTHPILKGSYLYPIYFEDYIYYINTKDNNSLYRMNKDGSEPTKLVSQHCSTYNITNSGKYLYYQVDNKKTKGIHRMNLSNLKDELMLSGEYKQINITKDYVFFQDTDGSNTYYAVADGDALVNRFDAPTSATSISPTPAATK